MKIKARAAFAPILLCGMLAQEASAFSRRFLPLPQAVAAADAIVVAQPLQVLGRRRANAGETVQVEVIEVLKGKVARGKAWVQLSPMHRKAFGKLATGRKWIFFLSASQGAPSWNVMLDGTLPYRPARASEIKAILSPKPSG